MSASTGMHIHQQKENRETYLFKYRRLICCNESVGNKKMKYLAKVFHEVHDYPMSVASNIAQN